MRLAVSAGGDAAENVAYVQTLLGNLELERGASRRRRAFVPPALARFGATRPPEAGLARAAARGDLGHAIRRYRALVRAAAARVRDRAGQAELAAGRTGRGTARLRARAERSSAS